MIPDFEQEMIDGYLDGKNRNSPEPAPNRSHSYRHGFQSGRSDLKGYPTEPFESRKAKTEQALSADRALSQKP